MSHAPSHCTLCRLPVDVNTPACPRCGSTARVAQGESALIDLLPLEPREPARSFPVYEEPMVRCAFCHRRIAAALAYHSRYDGRAVCESCKEAEETCA